MLEIGCGTGRNLIKAARAYPEARFYGLDVSREMLDTAEAAIRRAGLAERIAVAQGDATAFDPDALFGRAAFERVMISYALSMIPPWREALAPGARRRRAGRRAAHRRFRRLRWPVRAVQGGACAAGSPPSTLSPRDDLGETLAALAAARGTVLRHARHGGAAMRLLAVARRAA